MRSLWLLMLLSACRTTPPAPAQRPSANPAKLPGDELVYRFTDHAGEARLEGADLPAAWKNLSWPAKLPSPYSGLAGDESLRVVELALTDADVESFGAQHAANAGPIKLDAVWNRTRAVYQSKTSLFAPAGSRWTFEVEKGTHLRGSMATAPGSPPIDLIVELDGRERWRRHLGSAGVWFDFGLALDGARAVTLVAKGPPGAVAFWGDPLVFARDAGTPGPNVLLVIIDTLRQDALPVMPHLQALAQKGARFDQAITAATWTRPSLLALLGGDLPTTLGQSAVEMIPPEGDRRRFYSVAPPLLPRILQKQGWQADAIGNNFFLLGYPQIGLSMGFETVADVRHPVLDTPTIERAAEAYLAAHQKESWYLQVHFDGPHWPYTPPPEYLKRVTVPSGFPEDPMAAAYLAEAAYADDYLGRLLSALERLRLDDRTIVVVVGDHGEVFDHAHEHTVEALGQPTLHHHGWSAYDEVLRVPLIIVQPKAVPEKRVPQAVSLVDVMPTLLELLGRPPVGPRLGRSLVPLLRGGKWDDRPTFTEGQNVRAVRTPQWLYLRRGDGRLRSDDGKLRTIEEELYDLTKDPWQHQNRIDNLAERDRMRSELMRLAPTPPEAPVGVVHLRLGPGERRHEVTGLLRSEGAIAVRGVQNGEATAVDAHTLRVALRGQLDSSIDPPDARLSFELSRDGNRLGASDLLLGPYGLPLLDATWLEGGRWSWLDAARPPVDGEGGELLVWRDPSRASTLGGPTAHANDEVAGMMRRWGYAQPGK